MLFNRFISHLLILFTALLLSFSVFSAPKTGNCEFDSFNPYSDVQFRELNGGDRPGDIEDTLKKAFREKPALSSSAYARASLAVVSSYPLDTANAKHRIIKEDWMAGSKPITLKQGGGVAVQHLSNKKTSGCVSQGCNMADFYFVTTVLQEVLKRSDEKLIENDKFVVITMTGIGVVGLHKKDGDQTFLSLVDLINENGVVLLARGGMYELQADVYKAYVEPLLGKSKVGRVQLDYLPVRILRFVHPSHDSVITFLEENNPEFDIATTDARERQRYIWNEFIRQIDAVRLRLTYLDNLF